MANLSCDNRPDGQPPPLPPREYFTPLRQDYFVPVPTLFGQETIEKDILARRAAFYTSAQTFLSHEEWNSYCHFGFTHLKTLPSTSRHVLTTHQNNESFVTGITTAIFENTISKYRPLFMKRSTP